MLNALVNDVGRELLDRQLVQLAAEARDEVLVDVGRPEVENGLDRIVSVRILCQLHCSCHYGFHELDPVFGECCLLNQYLDHT